MAPHQSAPAAATLIGMRARNIEGLPNQSLARRMRHQAQTALTKLAELRQTRLAPDCPDRAHPLASAVNMS
ncbi:hypothetical protein C7S18_03085 [Ahniella affigens]|uniref:Uncharacterized protein n=1 Tax=Ahniella affigens TaxID=2021234 RepID=A0A2P1PN13_9GAMM|nr:hypothetical protein C7S18_03085 [Ahniella affigens]